MSATFKRGVTSIEANLTPLIDVTFLLIVFFVLVSQIVEVENVDMDLPRPRDAATVLAGDEQRAVINVVPSNVEVGGVVGYRIGTRLFSPDPAGPLVVERLSRRPVPGYALDPHQPSGRSGHAIRAGRTGDAGCRDGRPRCRRTVRPREPGRREGGRAPMTLPSPDNPEPHGLAIHRARRRRLSRGDLHPEPDRDDRRRVSVACLLHGGHGVQAWRADLPARPARPSAPRQRRPTRSISTTTRCASSSRARGQGVTPTA